MIVTPNNRVEKRARWHLGSKRQINVEVRSGLNEGDSVVLSGRASLAGRSGSAAQSDRNDRNTQ